MAKKIHPLTTPECICTICMHKIPKPSGLSCNSVKCPKCGNPMSKAKKLLNKNRKKV